MNKLYQFLLTLLSILVAFNSILINKNKNLIHESNKTLILKEQKTLIMYMDESILISECKVVGEYGNMKGYIYFCNDGSLRLR